MELFIINTWLIEKTLSLLLFSIICLIVYYCYAHKCKNNIYLLKFQYLPLLGLFYSNIITDLCALIIMKIIRFYFSA